MTDFEFLTTEFKQCELIWGKVYEEYSIEKYIKLYKNI